MARLPLHYASPKRGSEQQVPTVEAIQFSRSRLSRHGRAGPSTLLPDSTAQGVRGPSDDSARQHGHVVDLRNRPLDSQPVHQSAAAGVDELQPAPRHLPHKSLFEWKAGESAVARSREPDDRDVLVESQTAREPGQCSDWIEAFRARTVNRAELTRARIEHPEVPPVKSWGMGHRQAGTNFPIVTHVDDNAAIRHLTSPGEKALAGRRRSQAIVAAAHEDHLALAAQSDIVSIDGAGHVTALRGVWIDRESTDWRIAACISFEAQDVGKRGHMQRSTAPGSTQLGASALV